MAGRGEAVARRLPDIAPQVFGMPDCIAKQILEFVVDIHKTQAEHLLPLHQRVSTGMKAFVDRAAGFDVVDAAMRCRYLPIAHSFGTAPVAAPRRNRSLRNRGRGLRVGEFKFFGEISFGGQRLKYGTSHTRSNRCVYETLEPVSGVIPRHDTFESEYMGAGNLLFFGPLAPAGDFDQEVFCARHKDGTPWKWGDLLCRDDDDDPYVGVRADLGDYPADSPLRAVSSTKNSHFTLRCLRYAPEDVDDDTLEKARSLSASWHADKDWRKEGRKRECSLDMEQVMQRMDQPDPWVEDSFFGPRPNWPNRWNRCLCDWQSKTLFASSFYLPSSAEYSAGSAVPLYPDFRGGFGAGLRIQCPLVKTSVQAPYGFYILDEYGEDEFTSSESLYLDQSGLYYEMFATPSGPLSEIFLFAIHLFFKPFFKTEGGYDHAGEFTEHIDFDAPLPPLRPYAITISLVKASDGDTGGVTPLSEASILAYLDMLM